MRVNHDGDSVTVCKKGWSPYLKISSRNRISEDGTIKKCLTVDVSACLTGSFAEAEEQAKSYVEAFKLAREVLDYDE